MHHEVSLGAAVVTEHPLDAMNLEPACGNCGMTVAISTDWCFRCQTKLNHIILIPKKVVTK